MGTTAEKGARVLQSIAEVQEGINNLGGNLTDQTPFKDFKAQLDNIYNNLPKTEYGEGTEVNLGKTIKGKLDFDEGKVGIGQAKQDSTQGYNLIDINSGEIVTVTFGVDRSINGNEITLNGSRNDGETSIGRIIIDNITEFNSLVSGRTYKLTLNDTSGTYTGKIGLAFLGGSPLHQLDFIETNSFSVTKTLNFSDEVTKIWLIFNGNFSATNFKFKLMLQEGTSTYDWEPYTGGQASPNHSYPQEIKYVRGKNRFNKATVTQRSYIDAQGVLKGADGTYCASDYIEVYQGSIVWSATTGNGYSLSIYDSSKTFIRSVGRTGNNAMVIPIANGEKYIRFTLLTADLDITQIEEGTQATPYLPYNTIEEVVRGKNLFNYLGIPKKTNNVTYIANNETVKVTCVGAGNFTYMAYVGEDLTRFMGKTVRITANFVKSGDNRGRYAIGLSDINGENRIQKALVNNSGNTGYFVVENLDNTSKYLMVWLYGNSDGTAVTGDYTEYSNIIVTIDDEDMSYEPYITPTTKQLSLKDIELYGIGDYPDYIARSTGKNVYMPTLTIEGTNVTAVNSSISLTDDGEFTFVASGQDMYFGNVTRVDNYYAKNLGIKIYRNGNEKISFRMTNDTFDKNYITAFGSDNKSLGYSTTLPSQYTYTFPENCEYITFRFGYGSAITGTTYKTKVMMAYGDTIPDYEPYGIGKWYKKEYIGKVVLNGTEGGWSYNAGSSIKIRLTLDDANFTNSNTITPAYCDEFARGYWSSSETNYHIMSTSNAPKVLAFRHDESTSINDFKTWLSTHNATIVYPLATPIITEITDENMISQLEEIYKMQSINGTTIVETDGDLPPIVKIRGLKGE